VGVYSYKLIERGILIMATSKPTLNPLEDKPTNKTQITKPFMLAYIRCEKATPEDRAWFKALCKKPENRKDYVNPFTHEEYNDIIVPEIRKEFVDRFFPQLNAKKQKKTFLEEIEDL
jgi:hypothetical protein